MTYLKKYFNVPIWAGFIIFFIVMAFKFSASGEQPAPSVPTAPLYYVFDQTHSLSDHAIHALQTLLIEHDRSTGQQIMVGIFNSVPSSNPQDWTYSLFKSWKVGSRGQDNGILLVIFTNANKAVIEVGNGIDSVFSERSRTSVIQKYILPHLRSSSLTTGVIQGVYFILDAIDSPLMQSGQADSILDQDGLKKNIHARPSSFEGSWIFLFSLGIFLVLAVFYQVVAREAYFTAQGWHRNKIGSSLLLDARDLVRSLVKKGSNLKKSRAPLEERELGGICGNW